MDGFSDRSSTLLGSTRWTLDEHLLFQGRLCRIGVALMSKRTAEVKVLPWPPLLLCPLLFGGFVALGLLPLGKLFLPLFAVIVFPYLRHEKTGKGFNYALWKFDFIGCFVDLRFPLSKTRDKARRQEKQGKGKLFLPPGPVISSRREWRG